jgi:ribosomal protein S18 acetylase RimI-like enzyme
MYQAFMEAFRDYPVSFEMDLNGFRKKFIHKLKIDFDLSAGAFDGTRLVGFIFFSINEFEGKLTAYNGGTGVICEYRGQGLTGRMFEYLLPRFRARQIRQCVLEVLTSNEVAMKVYKKIGFRISKRYKCFRLLPYRYESPDYRLPDLSFREVKQPDWPLYTTFWDYSPSFLDSRNMIEHNLENEELIEAVIDDVAVGYTIFQSDVGRISHLAVDRSHRHKKIGTFLIDCVYRHSGNKYLTVINMIEKAGNVQEFLSAVGFENQLDQYEMILPLD